MTNLQIKLNAERARFTAIPTMTQLQERGVKAATDGLCGFELDNLLALEGADHHTHNIVRVAFNNTIERMFGG